MLQRVNEAMGHSGVVVIHILVLGAYIDVCCYCWRCLAEVREHVMFNQNVAREDGHGESKQHTFGPLATTLANNLLLLLLSSTALHFPIDAIVSSCSSQLPVQLLRFGCNPSSKYMLHIGFFNFTLPRNNLTSSAMDKIANRSSVSGDRTFLPYLACWGGRLLENGGCCFCCLVQSSSSIGPYRRNRMDQVASYRIMSSNDLFSNASAANSS